MVRGAFIALIIIAAAIIGFHGGAISGFFTNRVNAEIQAIIAWYNYDPEKQFFACSESLPKPRPNVSVDEIFDLADACQAHMDAWISRDGRKEVAKVLVAYMQAELQKAFSGAFPSELDGTGSLEGPDIGG